ncbi:unnamed protein product, partial [Candidula unifasciata]
MSSSNAPVTNESIIVTWDSSAECHVVSYYIHASLGVFISLIATIAVVGNSLVLYVYT